MRIRTLIFLFSLALVPAPGVVFAADGSGTDQLMRELEAIKARLVSIEQQQQDIRDKDAKILEELDRLRIWVHRK